MSNPLSWVTRAQLYRGVAVFALVAGYADLAHGGLTFAPLLLAAAYIVFLPLALLAR
jgi:hypothetical protein